MWDLAFNWFVDETHEHHAALPLTMMLACVALGLLWGWVRESAIIAMTWTGVLRIGKAISALRSDLILPRDAAPGVAFAILQIKLRKTFGRGAKHHHRRASTLVMLLDFVFGRLAPSERLWPWAPATLRRRFAQLLQALGIARNSGR